MRDQSAIVTHKLRGFYDRSDNPAELDEVPPGYCGSFSNLIADSIGARCRAGFESLDTRQVLDQQIYQRINEPPRIISLGTDGKLYDSVIGDITPGSTGTSGSSVTTTYVSSAVRPSITGSYWPLTNWSIWGISGSKIAAISDNSDITGLYAPQPGPSDPYSIDQPGGFFFPATAYPTGNMPTAITLYVRSFAQAFAMYVRCRLGGIITVSPTLFESSQGETPDDGTYRIRQHFVPMSRPGGGPWTEADLSSAEFSVAFDYGGSVVSILLDVWRIDTYTVTVVTPGTPGSATVNWTHFSILNLNNRALITPHNTLTGQASEFVYIYDGVNKARKAAGVAPSGSAISAADGAAGKVEFGTHLIAVAYETNTGFITPAGPAAFTVYSAPGSKKINLTGILTGGAEIAKRHILVSKRIANYDSNQANWELFFAPGGEIADNVTTTLTIDFYDADLVESADYLKYILSEIPASLVLGSHEGFVASLCESLFPSTCRISNFDDPETFSSTDGFVLADPGAGGYLTNFLSDSGSLYLFKRNKTLVTRNNGQAPADWPVNIIDGGLGAFYQGVSKVAESSDNTPGFSVVGNGSGIFVFSSGFPSAPITFNIDGYWRRLTPESLPATCTVQIDPDRRFVYILVPYGTAKLLLVCDYREGITPDAVKWYTWSPNLIIMNAILRMYKSNVVTGAYISGKYTPTLYYDITVSTGITTQYNDYAVLDAGSLSIIGTFLCNLFSFTDDESFICRFDRLRFRAIATISGVVSFILNSIDSVNTTTGSKTVAITPDKWYEVPMFLQSEMFSLQVTIPYGVTFQKFIMYGKRLWQSRPQ